MCIPQPTSCSLLEPNLITHRGTRQVDTVGRIIADRLAVTQQHCKERGLSRLEFRMWEPSCEAETERTGQGPSRRPDRL